MRLHILSDRRLRLETAGPGLEIVGGPFGPLQMLAASLALCTAAAVRTYGETANIDLAGYAVDLDWEYVDQPYRVGAYSMTLLLPGTAPEARHKAILRAAGTCTVHRTLMRAPTITTTLGAVEDAGRENSP
jgi:uncharacterized OsmC-like protein